MALSNVRVVFSNTVAQMIAKFVSALVTFIVTMIIANKLGAKGFGDFSKVIAFVPFFYLLTDFGLNAAFLRLRSQTKNITWSDLLGLRLILSFAAVGLCLAIGLLLPTGIDQGYTQIVKTGIFFFSVSIFFQALITTSNSIFQEKLVYHKSALAIIIGSLCTLLFIGILPVTFYGALLSLLLGTAITAAVGFIFALKLIKALKTIKPHHLKLLLVDAAPLAVTLFFNLVYFRIDTIILSLSRPTVEVGLYNFAYKLFEFPLVFPVFFMNSLFPLLLQSQKKQVSFKNTLLKAGLLLGGLGVVTSVFMVVFAPLLTVINPAFSDSVGLLQLLSLSLPFFFLSNLTMWILITNRQNRILVGIYGSSMIINLVANAVFIPRFGPIAAVLTTVVGEVIVFGLACAASYRYFVQQHLAMSVPKTVHKH